MSNAALLAGDGLASAVHPQDLRHNLSAVAVGTLVADAPWSSASSAPSAVRSMRRSLSCCR